MISLDLIKKWQKMVTNKSVFHVNQTVGQYFSVDEIKGYYNNLMDKIEVTKNLDEQGIPFNIASHGNDKKTIYFPIAIFQYGLGAYDLYLKTKKACYRDKMLTMANWALEHQQDDGSWNAFGELGLSCTVSAMAQGEGASLLARAFVETGKDIYRDAACKAIDFMVMPIENGGTAEYCAEGIILKEYPEKETVLNGWIFASFGLLDVWKASSEEKYKKLWNDSIRAIQATLNKFDAGHWSYYNLGKMYTSDFYHSLHIELLKALDAIAPNQNYKKYIKKWSECKDSSLWSKIAFIHKAAQKLSEKQTQEWVMIS